jgi:hypothetical protein
MSKFLGKVRKCDRSTFIVEFTIVFGMLTAAGVVSLRAAASKGALAATSNLLSALI